MSRKNPFVKSLQVKRIELEDGDWIELADRITIRMMEHIQDEGSKQRKGAETIAVFVKSWSFVDEEGKMVPVTVENILDLEVATFNEILTEVLKVMKSPKAQSQTSEKQSEGTTPTVA